MSVNVPATLPKHRLPWVCPFPGPPQITHRGSDQPQNEGVALSDDLDLGAVDQAGLATVSSRENDAAEPVDLSAAA